MNEVVTFLNANPLQYLATVGRDGKAKCRPFVFAGELGGRLWFCTNSTKEVYKDIQANPNVELSVSSSAYAWLRLSGKAVFVNNRAVKERCALPIPSSRASTRLPIPPSSRCSVWKMPMPSSRTSPAIPPGSTACEPFTRQKRPALSGAVLSQREKRYDCH